MRPIDPKALKRKKRPLADGKKTGVSARHPTKAVVLEPVLAKDQSRPTGKGERRSAPPRSPEARLEEALGLARAIDLEVRAQRSRAVAATAAGDLVRLRQGRRA